METPKPQAGTWTLTAPDGRTWEASSPLHCASREQAERVPAKVAIDRIFAALLDDSNDAKDSTRYRWLRDRMQVRHEAPVSGGEPRAVLMMRVGHGFLDSKMHPETGWTDPRYFDECREKVDAAIDAAIDAAAESYNAPLIGALAHPHRADC